MADRGLLLVNLGSPEAPTPAAVGRYLKLFLNDRFVIDLPAPLRYLLVNALIVPRRKYKSAEAYRAIWTDEGSPLVRMTKVFAKGVARDLAGDWEVRWAMRYGTPSLASVLDNWSCSKLYVVPLYPQYAESSTRTVIEEVGRLTDVGFRYLQDFFVEPEFVASEVTQIETCVGEFNPDHLLLSFHGLPEHHLTKLYPHYCMRTRECSASVTGLNRFCYRAQCFATARAIMDQLAFPKDRIHVGFQSRLGRRPWIKPYTDVLVDELANSGARRLLVACPSFVADCLETLEEVQIRLRARFISAGGDDLRLVPAPNYEKHWISNFTRMIRRDSLHWSRFQK
jgi:ferrochelatase